jgi:hypothetical protein
MQVRNDTSERLQYVTSVGRVLLLPPGAFALASVGPGSVVSGRLGRALVSAGPPAEESPEGVPEDVPVPLVFLGCIQFDIVGFQSPGRLRLSEASTGMVRVDNAGTSDVDVVGTDLHGAAVFAVWVPRTSSSPVLTVDAAATVACIRVGDLPPVVVNHQDPSCPDAHVLSFRPQDGGVAYRTAPGIVSARVGCLHHGLVCTLLLVVDSAHRPSAGQPADLAALPLACQVSQGPSGCPP